MTNWMDQPLKSLGRLAWNRSVLTPHPKALPVASQRDPIFKTIRNRLKRELPRAISLDTRPRLSKPRAIPSGSYQLPRYFSRGALEADRRKNPSPIWFLLTESLEQPISRPVPHNTSLIRSLCKGKGYLRQNKEGFTYLDVDNQFISAMTPYLRAEGLVRPPYFTLFSAPEGAHIPVIPKREAEFHYLETIKELDLEFSFEIEGLYSLKPDIWQEVEEVWFFKVRSPELEAFRRRYFLTPVPGCHDFHIVVAVKTPLSWEYKNQTSCSPHADQPGFYCSLTTNLKTQRIEKRVRCRKIPQTFFHSLLYRFHLKVGVLAAYNLQFEHLFPFISVP